jgi:hypothetical protein
VDRLTDFKPLQRVELPGLGELHCTGLILIVGPNSSGKTQLLQDLYRRIIGEPRTLVVATTVELRRPEQMEPFIQCLEREGYLTKITDDAGNEQLRPLTTFVGSGEPAAQIHINQSREWFNSYSVADVGKIRRRIDWLGYFGRLLVTGLFLEKRLTAVQQVGMFDFQAQPPQNDLHALYVDDDARAGLLAETRATFSRAVWPDASRGTTLCLRVSDDPDLPSADQRLSPRAMATFRTIETEGDGLKSYVATCIALLLGRRPVCLVDEPELCLHPPQAYNLGRFIGRYGASLDRATFVATHSSHILRGVLQSAAQPQIVRLIRTGRSFEAHLVPATVLAEILTRPTVRAETVLDGIFSQAVIVLEADSDRSVYQAVYETLADELRLDIHFTAVGGTGGIADTCRVYRTLKIPIAVIADLDILAESERLGRVVSALSYEPHAATLVAAAREVAAAIKDLPPTVDPEDVKSRLAAAAALPTDWSQNHDDSLRSCLQDLTHDLDRMRRLKRGGVAALPHPLNEQASSLIAALAEIGLFVVPVGELEAWLADRAVGASKRSKWSWANEAASKVRQLGPQAGDVWDFMRSVGAYLVRALEPAH